MWLLLACLPGMCLASPAEFDARAYAKRDDRTGQLITILDAKVDGPGRDLGPSIGPN